MIEACIDPRFEFGNITFGELREGLDTFYGDFRNKAVQINDALWYVRDQLEGKSSAELAKELEGIRAAARR